MIFWGLTHQAHAQQIVVSQPDCIIFFHLNTVSQTSPLAPNAGFSNLTNGCTTWNLSYANSGFSALSLVLQSAPNNNGVAGTWVTFAGATLLSGVNPNTATTQAFTWLTGYNPWVRVQLASATGTGIIDGAVYGYRIPSAGSTGTGTQTITGTVTANQGAAGASPWPVTAAQGSPPWTVDGPAASGAAPSGNPNWIAGLASGATGGFLYPITAMRFLCCGDGKRGSDHPDCCAHFRSIRPSVLFFFVHFAGGHGTVAVRHRVQLRDRKQQPDGSLLHRHGNHKRPRIR